MDTISNQSIKVSFIVPVYNVEKYIQKCVQSLRDQSYHPIEIILVDDGSKDESGKIIDKTAEADDRIKVIHQENAGVSTARNRGLEEASGDYILFIDGDDYIERDYAEYFINLIESNDADMAVNLRHFTVNSDRQDLEDDISIWNSLDVMEAIYLDKINVAVWNKIYKKEVIDKYELRFHPDIWFGEGMLFNIEYLQYAEHIAVGGRKVYHQVYNPESAMRKFKLENFICGLRSLDIQKSSWKKSSTAVETAWAYHRRNYARSILCGLVQTNAVKSNRIIYNKCKKAMRRKMTLPWKVDISFRSKIGQTLFSLFPCIYSYRIKYRSKRLIKKQERLLQNS